MPPSGDGSVVRAMRGGLVESVHRVAWTVVDDGEVVAASDPDAAALPVFVRSSVKPFQALAAVRRGVLERFSIDDRQLALACASHGGSEGHVVGVATMLAACGMGEEDLQCGPGEPRDPRAAAAVADPARRATRLRHNCSGKHALGLALCVEEGWPTAGYLDAGHPLQIAMRAEVAGAAEVEPESLEEATDGCGMRTFRLPLARLARAFSRLASGRLGPEGDRVVAAMRGHPDLVAFPGAIDTELMAAEPGLVAKVGAEGVIGVGLADGRALALKVLDGTGRAVDPAAVVAVRALLGVPAAGSALDRLAGAVIANSRGERVGRLEADLAGA